MNGAGVPLAGVSAVVPAAGRAERFGGDKLRADLAGEPLLTHTLRSLLDAGVAQIVVVTSRETDLEGVVLLGDERVTIVPNLEPDRGMFSSIQVGLAAVEARVVLVLPGDMPFVLPDTVRAVAERALELGRVVVPVNLERRGHPLALPGRLRLPLLGVEPTATLKSALAALGETAEALAVADPGILRDVDVRADLP